MNRNVSLDLLKVILAFMVVGIHGAFLKDYSPELYAMTAQGLFRIGVPTFLIISGYYFEKAIGSRKSIMRWIRRITLLYIFWMIVFAPLWFQGFSGDMTAILKMVVSIVFGYHHLWYINGLLIAGMIFYLLRNRGKFFLLGLSAILFSTGLVLQYAASYQLFESSIFSKILEQNFTYRNALFLSFPFFYWGYYIKQNEIKVSKFSSSIMVFVSLLLIMFESYFNFLIIGPKGFDILISLPFLCISLFLFTKEFKLKSSNKQIALVASAIYFTHPYFLFLLKLKTSISETGSVFLSIGLSIALAFFLIKLNSFFLKKLDFGIL